MRWAKRVELFKKDYGFQIPPGLPRWTPASDWSTPWKLDPGQSHQFDVGYSVTFRSTNGTKQQELTLPAGSHCEFLDLQGHVALYLARLPLPSVTELSSPKKDPAQP